MGKSGERETDRKTHMALHCHRREADLRVVQCLIHASAVSDSVGNAAEAFASEVMAKLRVRKPGCCGCGCVAVAGGVGMNLALNYSHFL